MMEMIKNLVTKYQCHKYKIPYQKGLWIHPTFRAITAGNISVGGGVLHCIISQGLTAMIVGE